MANQERRKRLLKLLAERQTATLHELVAGLGASLATVRRDITWLAEHKLLTRTRGGAETLAPKKPQYPLSGETFEDSIGCNGARKRAIARHAASMCSDGDTIIINAGTTTFMMAEFLAPLHLKILTNSFAMAECLVATSEHEVIVPGGKVYREQSVILSPFDNDISQHHYAARMFMSAYGLSPRGLMEVDPVLIQAEKRLIGQAEELVVLLDSSKFSKKGGLILCGLDRVTCVITDTDAPDEVVQELEASGIEVVRVDPELHDGPAAPGTGAAAPALHYSL